MWEYKRDDNSLKKRKKGEKMIYRENSKSFQWDKPELKAQSPVVRLSRLPNSSTLQLPHLQVWQSVLECEVLNKMEQYLGH